MNEEEKIQIIPSILEYTVEGVRMRARQVKGLVSRLQLDIVDGSFAKPPTWPFVNDDGSFYRMKTQEEGLPYWEEFDYEIDMMVTNPERYAEDWINAGAQCLIVHRSSVDEAILTRLHAFITSRDAQMAIAIRPNESIDDMYSWVEKITFLQVMGNNVIGVQGTPFDLEVLEKIKSIKNTFPALSVGVDIGVNRHTAQKMIDAGANRLSVGSAIMKAEHPEEELRWFQSLVPTLRNT